MADLTPANPRHIYPVPLPNRHRGPPRLPIPLTSFVGRGREIAAVVDLLRRPGVRLVTLIGPGGIGKTRLAVRVAEAVASAFPDGLWFVALAPVRDPALVTATIADALGLQETGGRTIEERLHDFLRVRRSLLVLDNFEHLLAAGSRLADLLTTCPELSLLVTSRSVLRLSGEHAVAVPPLSLATPDAAFDGDRLGGSEAVQLFVARAAAARSDVVPAATDVPAITAICSKLDGLPLAIELAAARVRSLPPATLLRKLEHSLALLTGGGRDQPPRLQSMREAITWSHDLLTPAEQVLLRRLAVFVGGFTPEAAAAVTGGPGDGRADGQSSGLLSPGPSVPISPSVFDGIASLVDQSLLQPGVGADGEPRFGMLETIREFGIERLAAADEEATIRNAHAAWCLAFAEQEEFTPITPGQERGLDRLDAERGNFRTALTWLDGQGEPESMVRLVGALRWVWYIRGPYGEARDWLSRARARAAAPPTLATAKVVAMLGLLTVHEGDLDRASTLIAEGLARFRDDGATWETGMSLLMFGHVAFHQGHYAEATARTREARDCFQACGNDHPRAEGFASDALSNLGCMALAQGDTARAADLLEEALGRQRRLGFGWGAAQSLLGLADVARADGDLARAATLYRESLALSWDQQDWRRFAPALAGLAGIASAWGQRERACLTRRGGGGLLMVG